jgi:hypothetical protein
MKTIEGNIEEYIDKIKQLGFDDSSFVGCSYEEIKILEEKYNLSLPNTYKSFLLKMGKKSGNLVDKNEFKIDYESVLCLTEDEINFINKVKQEILDEGADETVLELPKNALLILKRCDGSQFYLIIAEGGADSPVYYYNSDNEVIKKEFDSFWQVLDMFTKGPKLY